MLLKNVACYLFPWMFENLCTPAVTDLIVTSIGTSHVHVAYYLMLCNEFIGAYYFQMSTFENVCLTKA